MTSPSTAYCRKSPYGLTREPSRPLRARDPPPGVNGRSVVTGPVFRGGSIWPGARVDYMSHYSYPRPVSGTGQPGRTGLPGDPVRAAGSSAGEAGQAGRWPIWPGGRRAAPGLLSGRAAAASGEAGQGLGRGGRSEGAGGRAGGLRRAGRGKGAPGGRGGLLRASGGLRRAAPIGRAAGGRRRSDPGSAAGAAA